MFLGRDFWCSDLSMKEGKKIKFHLRSSFQVSHFTRRLRTDLVHNSVHSGTCPTDLLAYVKSLVHSLVELFRHTRSGARRLANRYSLSDRIEAYGYNVSLAFANSGLHFTVDNSESVSGRSGVKSSEH